MLRQLGLSLFHAEPHGHEPVGQGEDIRGRPDVLIRQDLKRRPVYRFHCVAQERAVVLRYLGNILLSRLGETGTNTVKMPFDSPPIGRTGFVAFGITEGLDKLPRDIQQRIMIPLHAGLKLLGFRISQIHVEIGLLFQGSFYSLVFFHKHVGGDIDIIASVFDDRGHTVVAALDHPAAAPASSSRPRTTSSASSTNPLDFASP